MVGPNSHAFIVDLELVALLGPLVVSGAELAVGPRVVAIEAIVVVLSSPFHTVRHCHRHRSG